MKQVKLLSCAKAAAMLGISADRLRHIKGRFDYVKAGNNQQGRLLFRADTLVQCYLRA